MNSSRVSSNNTQFYAANIMPTVSTITSCPSAFYVSTEVPSGPVMLALSSSLCVLTKAIADPNGTLSDVVPVALSYDGRGWEKAAGESAMRLFYGKEIGDYSEGSQLNLPNLNDTGKYYLMSYSHSVSEADKVARLLEIAWMVTVTAGDSSGAAGGPIRWWIVGDGWHSYFIN